MKKAFICFILLLSFTLPFIFLLSFTLPAFATNFVEVLRTDTWIAYVDLDSIEPREDYLVAWTRWHPLGEEKKRIVKILSRQFSYQMRFDAYNPGKRQMQPLEIISYELDGEAFENQLWPFSLSAYEEVIPGTNGAAVYDFVADYHRNGFSPTSQTPATESDFDTKFEKLSSEQKDDLKEIAVLVACHKYLKIPSDQFNPSDPLHLQAMKIAGLFIFNF